MNDKEKNDNARFMRQVYGAIFLVVLFGFFYFLNTKVLPKKDEISTVSASLPGMLPELASFLPQHPEWGKPESVQEVPNWASGKRQRVQFDSGRNLLFYETGGSITTVWEDNKIEGRKLVWGRTSPE